MGKILGGKMNERSLYRRRFFLSPDPNSDAFVSARVSQFRDEINGSIKIADCGRAICLEVNGFTKKDRRQTAKKLGNLIGVLEDIKAIVEGVDDD